MEIKYGRDGSPKATRAWLCELLCCWSCCDVSPRTRRGADVLDMSRVDPGEGKPLNTRHRPDSPKHNPVTDRLPSGRTGCHRLHPCQSAATASRRTTRSPAPHARCCHETCCGTKFMALLADNRSSRECQTAGKHHHTGRQETVQLLHTVCCCLCTSTPWKREHPFTPQNQEPGRRGRESQGNVQCCAGPDQQSAAREDP